MRLLRRRPGGLLRWRWRLGLFDSVAQVGNALVVLKGLTVEESIRVIDLVQQERERDGLEPLKPRALWQEAVKRWPLYKAGNEMAKRHPLP